MSAPNPSGKIAEPVNHNFAETSSQIMQMNYQNMLLKKQAINEGFKGKLTKEQAIEKQNFNAYSRAIFKTQLENDLQKLALQRIDTYIKDGTARYKMKQELLNVMNLYRAYELTGEKIRLTQAQSAYEEFKLDFQKTTGLTTGGIEGAIGNIILRGGKILPDIDLSTRTLDEQIKEARKQGKEKRAQQLENQKKLKERGQKQTINFGQRGTYNK